MANNDLERVTPPVIPVLIGNEYSPKQEQDLRSVLRLFFIRIVYVLTSLVSVDFGGKFLYFPAGSFHNALTITGGSTNTPYAIAFYVTEITGDIAVEDTTKITVQNDGTYEFVFTGQADAPLATGGTLTVWLAVNGINEPYSARQYTITGPQSVSPTFRVTLTATEYVEIMWAKDNADIQFTAAGATSLYPLLPSATLAAVFSGNSNV